jgi:AraC-like DNA-binding protein
MPKPQSLLHPIQGLAPALSVMNAEGFSNQQCLNGTGVLLSQLDDHRQTVTLQQEIRFYRNLLQLSADPTVGLRLGAAYLPQRYGLFGYAFLSAPTLRQALVLASKFGELTFTWFQISYSICGSTACMSMTDRIEIDSDVANLLRDRDCAAAMIDLSEAIGQPLNIERVLLPHDGHGRDAQYQQFFRGPVEFNSASTGIQFNSATLDLPLVHRDDAVANHLQQQCQLLLSKLSQQSRLVDDVRQILLARPGFFPDVEMVAEKLQQSTRSLRRHLTAEHTSYKDILDEVRFSLAKQYLSETQLPLQEIATLLAYSEPGNFTHAFKRWASMPPTEYRQTHKVYHSE